MTSSGDHDARGAAATAMARTPAEDLLSHPRGRGGILDCGSDAFEDSTMVLWGMPVRRAREGIDSAAGLRRLSRKVARGQAVRLRPGVYAPQPEWDDARPRQRYLATVAAMATARSGSPVFCRQAALVLHDLPLVTVPQTITTRTLRPGSARRRRAVAAGTSPGSAGAISGGAGRT